MAIDSNLVLVTRPEPAGSELAHWLQSHNILAMALPFMQYQPIKAKDHAEWHKLIAASPGLIFTSANGVRAFFDWMIAYAPELLLKFLNASSRSGSNISAKKIFLVGQVTAKHFQQYVEQYFLKNALQKWPEKILPELVGQVADGNSESLKTLILADKDLITSQNAKLIHIGGAESMTRAGEDLVTQLQMAGKIAEKLVFYHMAKITKLESNIVEELQKRVRHNLKTHLLIFSPRTITIGAELWRQYDLPASAFPIYALSHAVAKTAKNLGFSVAGVAKQPSVPAMLALLTHHH